MEKKELILTIAKDLFAVSYPKAGGDIEKQFKKILALVKKEYEALEDD